MVIFLISVKQYSSVAKKRNYAKLTENLFRDSLYVKKCQFAGYFNLFSMQSKRKFVNGLIVTVSVCHLQFAIPLSVSHIFRAQESNSAGKRKYLAKFLARTKTKPNKTYADSPGNFENSNNRGDHFQIRKTESQFLVSSLYANSACECLVACY